MLIGLYFQLATPHLVTAHIRLRDIAAGADDRFGEAFHRGAGLLLLVALVGVVSLSKANPETAA